MQIVKFSIVFILLFSITSLLSAQTKTSNLWSFRAETEIASKAASRQITPSQYQIVRLEVELMQAQLSLAPLWHTQNAEKHPLVITLPMPDGSFQRFSIVEAPVMHADLQAKFPEIRAYAGQGIDDPYAYFRGDFTLRGFHGMIRNPHQSTIFIDPYSSQDLENYQVYYKKDFSKNELWECGFDEVNQESKSAPLEASRLLVGDCQLRDYTLALSCTGEYATFHGGTVPLVMSAFTTSMARVNGVFELDASVHMTLHPNTNLLVYLNAATDPFSNGNGNAMLTENQTTCDNIIGNANYDIGHVYSTGGGGVAYRGSVCNNTIKAGGVTGQANPIGDPFDIDFVAHEMGHQFGANHTQNNNCNRNNSTAMEPGSASTIMGYAGICSPNVQSNSDDYFHAISLQEIAAEVTSNLSGGGNTCSTNSTINGAPTANAGLDYTIPKSTPFFLTGSGTDPNGNALTYTWEQMDFAIATMPPVSSNTGGPAFRSFKGTSATTRYIPRLTDVINNVNPTWEVLPSVGRTLNFRLTVRDNVIGGGCTAEDNRVVTVNGTAGPFLVTSPNTAVNWPASSTQNITWDVASTNVAPINCANVDILLSTDGGLTYPTTLATATPNDGSHVVLLPNVTSTTARIMVRANGNIFYDISNTNFTISVAVFGFSIVSSPSTQSVCAGTSAPFPLTIGANGGFSGNVNLSTTGLPSGATASFSTNPVAAPGSSNMTITTVGVAPGTYTVTVNGVSGANTANTPITLTVLSTAGPNAPTLATPANGATGIPLAPALTWASSVGATTYQVQVSTTSTFTTTVVNATGLTSTSYTISPALISNTVYYWRGRAVNTCGTGAWSAVFNFTAECTSTFVSTNVPLTISATGTPTVNSTLTVSGLQGGILSLKVKTLAINHTYVGDLKVTLRSPANVDYILFDRPGVPASTNGCDNNHISALFDQAATLTSAQFESACNVSTAALPPPYAISGTYRPVTSFAGLVGTAPNGTWTLIVQDLAGGDGGSIEGWSLEIATSCETAFNLSQTYIQGYVDGFVMKPVLLNSGVPGATSTQCDTITVALHASTTPYAQVHTSKAVLNTNGTAVVNFPSSALGNSYYVVIKGRNLVETWSAAPQTIITNGGYNFGSTGQAFGSNLRAMGNGIVALYSGDINLIKDGVVDLVDYPIWEADYNNFSSGYIRSDLNGDGTIDLLDYPIWEENYNNFIGVSKP
jgi:subtilisin-like proprotein convertase family protein